METNKENKRDVYSEIDKIINPIFNKVLKETKQNHTMVGKVGSSLKSYCFYQPHNCRLYFDFSKLNFQTIPNHTHYNLRVINKSEYQIYNFENYNLRIKKTQVELIYNPIEKKFFKIELGIDKDIFQQVKNIWIEIIRQGITALEKFISVFGGNSEFNLLNARSEDKIVNEDMINLIPEKMTFYNDVVKKVYNEKNVEFSNPVQACNYLTNRSIEDITPSIVEAINGLGKQYNQMSEGVLKPLTAQIKLHLKVQRETLKTQKQQAQTMSEISQAIKEITSPKQQRAKELLKEWGW